MSIAIRPSLAHYPDILYGIFACLDPADHSDYDALHETRRSLAFSARVCREFSAPALSVLWRQLPDDQPLADLLCALGIAAKERDLEAENLDRTLKPGRYNLPTREVRGYPNFAGIAAYERHWKQSRGYEIAYVSGFAQITCSCVLMQLL